MFLLGNLGQQLDIEDQRRDLEALRDDLSRQRPGVDADRLNRLERENAELRLYLAALVRYLVAKGTINPSDFQILVNEIDREDGQQDGGFQGKVL